tara:strand:+ start:63 stop:758 length:696 start_codon:yes stop_codon:yes gene_type:complete
MAKLLAEKNKLENSRLLYLILSGLFISALVTCNLIANKFVTVDLGFKTFVVSAGVLPYPLTFLITDILSEIYGRKRTNNVVLAGLIASILVLFILYLGSVFPAIDDSPVANETYNSVFQNSSRIIFASMLAYTVAQFVDVHVFHFLKKLTGGKKLWIRNNFSTIFSQLLDTILVTTVIFIGLKDFTFIGGLIWDGWLFKFLFAAVDTLFIYLIVYGIRSYFQLKPNEELSI